MNLTYLIKRPIITEKSMMLAGQNKYTFEVDPRATKGQIKSAVAEFFGVKVMGVKTIKMPGWAKRKRGRRGVTVIPDRKKAVVEVGKGQKIDIFDIETEEPKNKKTKKQKNDTVETQKQIGDTDKKVGIASKVAGMLTGKGKSAPSVKPVAAKVQKSGDK